MHGKLGVGRKLGAFITLMAIVTLAGCGDDSPSGPGADAILGSWEVTSFVQGGVDLVNGGMGLTIGLNSGGSYLIEVTNDQIEICAGAPGQNCQVSGSFAYTSTTVTIDDDQPADAVTFTYAISGGNFMTWTGTVGGFAVEITMQRT